MMIFRRRSGNSSDTIEEDPTLIRDLESLYNVPVPALTFDTAAITESAPRLPVPASVRVRSHWRPVAGVAVLVLIAVAIAVPVSLGGDTAHVNAQQIFSRAQVSASTGATSLPYHVVATTDVNGKDAMTTETWYNDAIHFRSEQRSSDGVFGSARNGDESWLYYQDANGNVRAAHGSSLDFWSAASQTSTPSISDILSKYTADGCQSASQQGEATVAGRAAYVVVITPTPATCTNSKLAAVTGLGTTIIWVDEATYLTLKTESKNASDNLTYSYAVTTVQVGDPSPASIFDYQPPAAAIVTQVTTAQQAKEALAGQPNVKSGGTIKSPDLKGDTASAKP